MTWIKICGTTNLEDARTAVNAGADALGFVFYDKSPRKIGAAAARDIAAELPPNIEKVGVFVDQSPAHINAVVASVGLTAVQLHGRHSNGYLDELIALRAEKTSLKLILVRQADELVDNMFTSEDARKIIFALLVDSGSSDSPGGTGKTFDWNKKRGIIQSLSLTIPIMIAGGLNPENVGEAMNLLQPFGVDVASGVEARPGKKDPEKVRAFVQAVRRAEKKI
jgi:phosphoribosylanthranilate isomerase